uniref:Uncharacterized protein n=1 Tax=Salix viminalis TaxID=40686 RepID=A0A6N2K216_SALVM
MHTCIKLIGFIFVWLLTNKYQRKPPISPLLSSPLYSFAIQCVSCLSDHLFIVSFCLVLLISLLVRLGCCFVEIKLFAAFLLVQFQSACFPGMYKKL